MMEDSDRLRDLVRRANMDPSLNGAGPPVAQARPSGWVCPVCHTEPAQAAEPLMVGGMPMGFKYLTEDDGSPSPLSVKTQEVTEKNPDGTPKNVYTTTHCLDCFNRWQRMQMMRDIRANVPQLVRKSEGT